MCSNDKLAIISYLLCTDLVYHCIPLHSISLFLERYQKIVLPCLFEFIKFYT